jgi:outer membrane murein-binding lipoprotein Lpp
MSERCDHKFVDSTGCLKCGWTPPTHDPARAARLTAIAARRRKAVAGDPYPFADIDTLSAHVETLTQQVAALQVELDATLSDHMGAEARAEQAGIVLHHARSQAHADGYQTGWHAALSRVADGDAVDDLSQLCPKPQPNEAKV